MATVELKDHDHMYYSVSTLQELIDEIKDKHRWDISIDGRYIEGIMTAMGDLLGMLNSRHPDLVVTQEAIDIHQLQDTIDDLRKKNKELTRQITLAEGTMDEGARLQERLAKEIVSLREKVGLKENSILSLRKENDELSKNLTELKNCDYFTIKQVQELVPEHCEVSVDVLPSEAIFTDGWNACIRKINANIAKTAPAGRTLDEVMLADNAKKLQAEVQALEKRKKQLEMTVSSRKEQLQREIEDLGRRKQQLEVEMLVREGQLQREVKTLEERSKHLEAKLNKMRCAMELMKSVIEVELEDNDDHFDTAGVIPHAVEQEIRDAINAMFVHRR